MKKKEVGKNIYLILWNIVLWKIIANVVGIYKNIVNPSGVYLEIYSKEI